MAEEPNHGGIDAVKRRNGVLSFRSRKMLNSLSKKTGVIYDRREVLPIAREEVVLAEVPAQEAERTKTSRQLWNPTKDGDDHNLDTVKPKTLNILKQQPPIEKNQRKEENVKNADEAVAPSEQTKQEIPSKFKLLETFYEGLEAAISLLRIRRQMCTFKAVCRTVESISKRRFLLKHLGQIKHIFGEVLQLEHVRCRDPDTWCERWDLRITLLPLPSDRASSDSPLKGLSGQTAQSVRRRKEFHSRLLKFISSNPKEAEIPQEPLPKRSLGGSLPCPEGQLPSASSLSEQTHKMKALGSPIELGELKGDPFTFSIVKKPLTPRDAPAQHLEGTSHFSASFKPFFSVKHRAEANLGDPVQCPEVTPHFPASFKPFFSAKQTAEASDGGQEGIPSSLQEVATPSSPQEEARPSPPQESATPCSPQESATPNSPWDVATPSSPKVHHGVFPFSPVPVHTPSFLSPSSNLRTFQNHSPYGGNCHTPAMKSSIGLGPPKSQGISRSLKFESPVTSSHPKKAVVDEVTGPNTPFGTHISQVPEKNVRSRSLQFDTPLKACNSNSMNPAEVSGLEHGEHLISSSPLSGSATKSLQFVSPTKCFTADLPSTPDLRTPIRACHTKEILFSPPKRTRLNRGSLFVANEEGTSSISVKRTVEETIMDSSHGARAGDSSPGVGNLAKTPTLKVPELSPAEDMKGFSKSDLDIIQGLPLDLVQSVLEKERKIKDEYSAGLAIQKRRQQMMGGVPKLFNHLRLIFQSVNRTVLPRSELIQKILASHPDITDKGEVEERLKLIVELAPDWLTTSDSHTGDLLYRIDKKANVTGIQRKLSFG